MSEQVLVRGLPVGTKAILRVRAQRNHRNAEAEARAILTDVLARDPVTLVDLLRADDTDDIEFEPAPLVLESRTAVL